MLCLQPVEIVRFLDEVFLMKEKPPMAIQLSYGVWQELCIPDDVHHLVVRWSVKIAYFSERDDFHERLHQVTIHILSLHVLLELQDLVRNEHEVR